MRLHRSDNDRAGVVVGASVVDATAAVASAIARDLPARGPQRTGIIVF